MSGVERTTNTVSEYHKNTCNQESSSIIYSTVGLLRGDTMARKSIEQRLAQLDAQRKTLQARLTKDERARDTRRKVLLGALVLHRIEDGNEASADYLRDFIKRELPGFLTRETDKALFDDLLTMSTHRSNNDA